MATQAFAPPMEASGAGGTFRLGSVRSPPMRDLGESRSSVGISKMGQRDLRRLPVAGLIAVIRWAFRLGADDPWLAALPNRKPPMPPAAELANKMARMARAAAAKNELFRASVSA